MRKNATNLSFQTEKSRLAFARNLFQEHCKQQKKYFWDSVWQLEQKKKGAKKGGQQKSLLQTEARKRIGKPIGKEYGKTNGRTQGIRNQNEKIKEILSFSYVWSHSTYGTFETTTQKALIDIAEQCLSFSNFKESLPEKSEKRQIARQLGRVLRKERDSYYGWSFVHLETKN